MVTILVVEDEPAVRMLTRAKLKNKYRILEAENGEKALEVMEREHCDLIIADIMMPKMDGYELVEELRAIKDMTPVIFLTAMNTFAHKRKGYALGIDDYMTKPINYEELEWRIEALLRRANIANMKQIVIGDFVLSEDTMSAEVAGKQIRLTDKEFQFLFKLLSYPDQFFTKQQIMDDVWGYETESDYNTIKTYVNRIRHKFDQYDYFDIVSLRGVGYKATINKKKYGEN